MARIRTIKPDFFRHVRLYRAEKESKLPLRVAFAGLWTAADREGRFAWEPEALKLDCLPYDAVNFDAVLNALEIEGFIVRYRVDGREYGCIPSWARHQVINNREQASCIPPVPATPDVSTTSTREARVVDASGTREARVDDFVQGKGREGKGMEGNGREGVQRAPIHDRSHKNHAFCGRVCLPASLLDEFKRRRNHPDAYKELSAWFNKVDDAWSENGPHATDEPGDVWDFWKARYAEQWPASAAAVKAKSETDAYTEAAKRRTRELLDLRRRPPA